MLKLRTLVPNEFVVPALVGLIVKLSAVTPKEFVVDAPVTIVTAGITLFCPTTKVEVMEYASALIKSNRVVDEYVCIVLLAYLDKTGSRYIT